MTLRKNENWHYLTGFLTMLITLISFVVFYLTKSSSSNFNWTGIDDETQAKCENFIKSCDYECTLDTQLRERRRQIIHSASLNEMLKLQNHPDDKLRALSNQYILLKSGLKFKDFKKSMNDTNTIISVKGGCVSWFKVWPEYLMENVLHWEDFDKSGIENSLTKNLSQSEKEEIFNKFEWVKQNRDRLIGRRKI